MKEGGRGEQKIDVCLICNQCDNRGEYSSTWGRGVEGEGEGKNEGRKKEGEEGREGKEGRREGKEGGKGEASRWLKLREAERGRREGR